MSATAQISIAQSPEAQEVSWSPLVRLLRSASPSEGWLTLALLLGSLLAVVWSVHAADWVETPSLSVVMTLAVLMGLIFAKLRGPAPLLHLAAAILGAAVVYWQTATLADANGWPELFQELNQRLHLWWSAATGDGISTDTIPLALTLTSLTWIIGYASAWAIFHRRSLWLGVLPGGLALTSNLSYLPDRFVTYLFLYLFLTMLLAVRLHALQHEGEWQRQGVTPPESYHFSVLHGAFWFSATVFLLGIFLPLGTPINGEVKETWKQIRWPMRQVEGEFDRLLSGVPSRKPQAFRNFGSHLPFLGPISLKQKPLFQVETTVSAYWRARVYPEYTSQGWQQGTTETHDLSWAPPLSQPSQNLKTTEIEYSVTLLHSPKALPVGSPSVSAETPMEITVPLPEHFLLSVDPAEPLPEDLPSDLTSSWLSLQRLWPSLQRQGDLGEALIRLLPQDVVVTQLFFEAPSSENLVIIPVQAGSLADYPQALKGVLGQGTETPVALQVMRTPSASPDVLTVQSRPRLRKGSEYTITSRISSATPEELRGAGTDYPGWVTDTYLQIPASLPQRVRDLARELTAGASTPFDKAIALQDYLKSFPYDQKIPPPPFDSDGVDHFLFTTQRGYSDYFGSALTVLLRSIDVPARLVAGYAPGDWDPDQKAIVVRDLHSHAWTEVYFPGYGWVEFEPTPGRTLPQALQPETEQVDPSDILQQEDPELEEEFDFFQDVTSGKGLFDVDGGSFNQSVTLGGIALMLGAFLGLGAVWYLYQRLFVQIPTPQVAFDRMSRLANLAGLGPAPQQTPREYAQYLSSLFPEVQQDVGLIAETYGRAQYGGREIPPEEWEQVTPAWRRVRVLLLGRFLRRFALPWIGRQRPSGRAAEVPEST